LEVSGNFKCFRDPLMLTAKVNRIFTLGLEKIVDGAREGQRIELPLHRQ
jgi:hypothetical protein